MKISVSSYSFNQYIKDGRLSQYETIEKAKEIGFDAIEFIDLKPCEGATLDQQKEYAQKLNERAKELDIAINAYTIGANLYFPDESGSEKEIERLCNQLDVAKILGVSVMRHDVCGNVGKTGSSRSFDLMLPTIADNARRVTEYAATLGIKTCSENHGYVAQDSIRVEKLFNAVNHENYGLLVDMGNFLCVDEDPATAVSRVAPYAVHAHCKDMHISDVKKEGFNPTRGGKFFKGAVVGEGVVPVKRCIRTLKFAGYDGYLSIEYEGSEDCVAGITRGFKNLKRFIAELENE